MLSRSLSMRTCDASPTLISTPLRSATAAVAARPERPQLDQRLLAAAPPTRARECVSEFRTTTAVESPGPAIVAVGPRRVLYAPIVKASAVHD